MKLCSACLLGIKCRYNAKDAFNKRVAALYKKEKLLPVCPEVLAGLPIPREAAEIKGGKVFDQSGQDLTESFKKGAEQVLKIAQAFGIKQAILKQKSPSCGCGKVYDGTFSGTLIEGDGLTAALLKKHGIRVVPDDEI